MKRRSLHAVWLCVVLVLVTLSFQLEFVEFVSKPSGLNTAPVTGHVVNPSSPLPERSIDDNEVTQSRKAMEQQVARNDTTPSPSTDQVPNHSDKVPSPSASPSVSNEVEHNETLPSPPIQLNATQNDTLSSRLIQFNGTQNETMPSPLNQSNAAVQNETTPAPSMAPRRELDIFIAGFPKCGTTTLLYSFIDHNETDISKDEECAITDPFMHDPVAFQQLDDALNRLSARSGIKRAIKCPLGITNERVVERLVEHSPRVKILIGVRHPVLYFQSYYNYRVTEMHDLGLHIEVPPIESLIERTEWNGVSTDSARFELFLLQLGKTNVTLDDLADLLGRSRMAIKPNTFEIFFYSLEQMNDQNTTRSQAFLQGLQEFLALESPIPPLGVRNKNHFVGQDAYNETVNICKDDYNDLRQLLLQQGKTTARWIKEQFLASSDVKVANGDHLIQTLDTWQVDPCGQSLLREE